MRLIRHAVFVVWFAAYDLFAQNRARRVGMVSVALVAGVVAVAVTMVGLALGWEALQKHRLEKQLLATSLWMVRTGNHLPLQLAEMADIEQHFRDHLSAGHLRGCYPFERVKWDWEDRHILPHRPNDRILVNCSGRTLLPGDPLLSAANSTGPGFPTPQAPGVLATREMLRKLHVPEVPGETKLKLKLNVATIETPLLGILDRPLPGGLDFVVTAEFARGIREENANPLCTEIESGPLPAAWAAIDDLPKDAEEWIARNGAEWVGPRPKGQGDVWIFKSDPNGIDLFTWQEVILVGFAERVYKDQVRRNPMAHIAEPSFYKVNPLLTVARPMITAPGYNNVVLYLRQLSDFAPAAESAAKVGLGSNDDIVQQIVGINQASGRTWRVLGPLLAVGGLFACFVLYVLHDLRAEQKRSEIGMLKGLGMSGWQLLQIHVVEAFFVWLIGAALGFGLGYFLGVRVAGWLETDPHEQGTAFLLPAFWIAAIALVSMVIGIGSVIWATRRARRASPLENMM